MTGRLFIIAGPAGAGKNRLMGHVLRAGIARQLPTATTRAIRPGEQEGREHLYVSRAEFERMIAAEELLEWQPVHDNLYGIHRPTLEHALAAGESIIADIDIKGAQAARAVFGRRVVIVFVQTPTIADLIDRMRIRGETTASIGLRLLRVGDEIAFAAQADAVITNETADLAADKLVTIVRAVLADANAGAYCDEPIAYRYALHAQALVIHHGCVLTRRRAPEYPVTDCAVGEQPGAAARRALASDLSAIADSLTANADASLYRAPAAIDHRRDADGVEVITYSYIVPLSDAFPAPDGWTWTETGL